MASKVPEVLALLERKRKSGIGITGAELRKYSDADRKEALRQQEDIMVKEGIVKKSAPSKGDDILESQSLMRKKFMGAKGYK